MLRGRHLQQYCNKCSFRCDSESALGTHMELHGLSAPFICTVCDYGSFSQNVVRFHEMNHHLDAPLTTLCKDASSKTDQSKVLLVVFNTAIILRDCFKLDKGFLQILIVYLGVSNISLKRLLLLLFFLFIFCFYFFVSSVFLLPDLVCSLVWSEQCFASILAYV